MSIIIYYSEIIRKNSDAGFIPSIENAKLPSNKILHKVP
ncbi:MAG: hypothetical protein DF168_01357 [Candidatus Moanabacter tarae]|uniref:Uncharacterized protein n=1 Tax=Candidatus Moanibacter tarae TaxID=2200854 RepID=A0A2Z4AF76_9BACT|nr:MAG: hypothetical protein DF168_01357 [Candidatus Moanabacter tarae]